MSSLVRRIQLRIFEKKSVDAVPILDNAERNRRRPDNAPKQPEYRMPFSSRQLAFIGERRIFPGDKHPYFQPLIDLLEEEHARRPAGPLSA